jgi:hypothetical protein
VLFASPDSYEVVHTCVLPSSREARFEYTGKPVVTGFGIFEKYGSKSLLPLAMGVAKDEFQGNDAIIVLEELGEEGGCKLHAQHLLTLTSAFVTGEEGKPYVDAASADKSLFVEALKAPVVPDSVNKGKLEELASSGEVTEEDLEELFGSSDQRLMPHARLLVEMAKRSNADIAVRLFEEFVVRQRKVPDPASLCKLMLEDGAACLAPGLAHAELGRVAVCGSYEPPKLYAFDGETVREAAVKVVEGGGSVDILSVSPSPSVCQQYCMASFDVAVGGFEEPLVIERLAVEVGKLTGNNAVLNTIIPAAAVAAAIVLLMASARGLRGA